jgi:hypothetical protein
MSRLKPVGEASPKLGYQKKTAAKQIFGKGQDMTQKTLYEVTVDGKITYGHKLAVNSKGQWVLEEKGTGNVLTVEKAYVAEVMPYTVAIKFCGVGNDYNFFAKEGDVEVGDIVYVRGYNDWGRVSAIGTKSKRATVWLNGAKLASTEIINEGEAD